VHALVIYGPVWVVSLAAAFVLTLLVRGVARRLGVVDRPDGFRKVQDRPLPRLGGVAIFPAYFGAVVLCGLVSPVKGLNAFLAGRDFLWFLAGASLVLAVGVWDDVANLRARRKFLLLTLISLFMYSGGFRIDRISHPFSSEPMSLGVLALPVTLFWFLGFMNAMNLIDGLDGLAAGVALFAAATVCVSSMILGNVALAVLALALVGAAMGFLVFNFPPASIYLGDSGSLLLGFLLAGLGLHGSHKSRLVVGLLIPVIAMGLPVMDTTLAILRRWARALPVSAGDRQHIHHRLLDRGFSHRQSVLLLYAGCLALAGCALLMTAARSRAAAVVLGVLGLGFFATIHLIGRKELLQAKRRLGRLLADRRQGRQTRAAGYAALERMARAEDAQAVWDIFASAAGQMELDAARMRLEVPVGGGPDRPRKFLWVQESPDRGSDPDAVEWSVALPLVHNGVRLGELRVSKTTNGVPVSAHLPEMLEVLRRGLAAHLSRVRGLSSSSSPPRGGLGAGMTPP